MKRLNSHILIFLAVLLYSPLSAQESLVPLSSAPRHHMPKSNDTLLLELPFFDDFSNYEGIPSPKRWLSFDAFVNKDYAPEPPTVGMVTLDALNKEGNLYPHASTNLFSADTLASQIIRLDSITSTHHKLQPSDSVYLSFFFLPGGWYGNMWERVGSAPSPQDSLFLEFYAPSDSQWHTVWCSGGFDADTSGMQSRWPWHFVSIPIVDTRFFTKSFQFRFRNYASLDANPKNGIAGNCDQWNIDYVYLHFNRQISDSIFRDIAFVERAPSMLKHYYAMPANQFAPSDMADQLAMKIVNRYNQTLASSYAYTVYDEDNNNIGSYDGGFENIVPFFPNGNYQQMTVHCAPPVNFTYPVTGVPAEFHVVHVVREGVGGDNHVCNDTLEFTQKFSNYYAYDDGVPENGYGLTATGSRLWLAQRYDLRLEDTLTAVDLYFNRTRNDENTDIPFQICIWSAEHGKPGALLYKENTRMQPEFDGMNRYHRYLLSEPQVVSDTIFVGFEQLNTDFINLGFDRSNDAREFLYYRTGNEWLQSILSGAVMMRPVFRNPDLVGIDDRPTLSANMDVTVFPNPTKGMLHLRCNDIQSEQLTITLFDMHGKRVLQQDFAPSLNVESLPAGVYLLQIENKQNRQRSMHKIIITQ